MRSGMSAAALALALVAVDLVLSSSVDAVRTRELFAQSTYDNGLTVEPTTVFEEKAAVGFAAAIGPLQAYPTPAGCPADYWISNPQKWPAIFTVQTTVGDALGAPARTMFGETTLYQGLQNKRADGFNRLLRSACTAILNSYTVTHYEFTPKVVTTSFASALSSSNTAASQAVAFDAANGGSC